MNYWIRAHVPEINRSRMDIEGLSREQIKQLRGY